jgi:hypothetical protein
MITPMTEKDLMPQPMSQRVPVVWLTNEGGHDYKDAERFGRLMPITTGSVNPFNPDRLMVLISHRLRVATAEDFLAISGSPMLNALALAMWLRRFKTCRVLLWSHRDTQYKELIISGDSVERLAIGEGRIAP